MNNNFDEKKMSNAINMASKKLGMDPKQLLNSVQNDDAQNILKNLRPEDAKKLQDFLSNKTAANNALSSDKAQSILKSLFGNKN
ncbi:MAG: hypothetical protein Q4B04_04695 [bacterium]|nr:hypothetical protein [bacterium]